MFIDARNVFTQVDRAHRKFSDEQIKNLGIISRLYHGDRAAFQKLLLEYQASVKQHTGKLLEALSELSGFKFLVDSEDQAEGRKPGERVYLPDLLSFDYSLINEITSNNVIEFKAYLIAQNESIALAQSRLHQEKRLKKGQEKTLREYDDCVALGQNAATDAAYYLDNLLWLLENFPEGTYRDVIGLCKAAKLSGEDGVRDQDYSLNAGRYVGVVIEDDGMTEAEFRKTMLGLNVEFEALNEEARNLEAQIAVSIKALFGE